MRREGSRRRAIVRREKAARQSAESQRQLAAAAPFVPFNKIHDAVWQAAKPQVRAPAQFLGDVGRNVTRPVGNCVLNYSDSLLRRTLDPFRFRNPPLPVQPLANGSKHFQPGGLTIRIQHIGAYNTFAYNELAYNEGYSYLVVDLGMLDGVPNVVPAIFLFEVVVRFWRDFLRLHGPYPELPKGRALLSDEQSTGQPQASPSDTW